MIDRPNTLSPSLPSDGNRPKSGEKSVTPPGVVSESGIVSQFLRSLPVFSSFSSVEIATLADSSRITTIAASKYVTNEGDELSEHGYIVVTGRLALMKTSMSGKELVVELLARGDILGLLIMLSLEGLPEQVSIRAQTNSQILWVSTKVLNRILDSHPVVYREFVAHLLYILQSSFRLARGLAHDRVEVRIATLLTHIAGKFSRPSILPDDCTIDITRQQIADLVGTTAETAIRVTRSMQRSKFIDIRQPGVVHLIDFNALQVIAEGE